MADRTRTRLSTSRTYCLDPDGDITLVLRDEEGCNFEALPALCKGGSEFKEGASDEIGSNVGSTPNPNASCGVPLSLFFAHPKFRTQSSTEALLSEEIAEEEEEDRKKTLRVLASSKHLSLASAYFKARFRPDAFQEGLRKNDKDNDGSSGHFADMELPDPCPAMLLVLLIVHGRPRKVPKKLSLEMLVQVAKIVDYYQFHDVVEHFSSTWMEKMEPPNGDFFALSAEQLFSWMSVYFIFDKPGGISSVAKALEVNTDGSPPPEDLPLPVDILDKIEEKRQQTIAGALEKLKGILAIYESGRVLCSDLCDSTMLGSLVKQLRSQRLIPDPTPPYQGLSVQDLLYRIQLLNSSSYCTYALHTVTTNTSPTCLQRVKSMLNDIAQFLAAPMVERRKRMMAEEENSKRLRRAMNLQRKSKKTKRKKTKTNKKRSGRS